MKARTPIMLALLVAATAVPTAQSAVHVSTTLDPAIAAAIRSHESPQSAVPLMTENSTGRKGLDPAIATAMRSHETVGGLDPAIATAMRSHESSTASASTAVAASNGFDWMAAGIGATVAVAAMLLGLATAPLLPRRSRAQRA